MAEGFTCKTLELPWRDNARQRSCVPPGSYLCEMVSSPKFGRVYTLRNTDPRTHIPYMGGKFAGDNDKRLQTPVQGCILIGKYYGAIDGQRAILLSRPTVRAFMAKLGGASFMLTIEGSTS